MREICLVTENGITRQAEDSSEFKKKSAEWYVHYDDYELLKKEIKELEAKLKLAVEALDKVSANKTKTVYNSSEEFMAGANIAFGQSAELADAALAEINGAENV